MKENDFDSSNNEYFKTIVSPEYIKELEWEMAIGLQEIILNGDSAFYGDFNLIEKSLEYDLNVEKNKNYSKMNIVDVIKNITDFTSRIWQIHPFEEGNTRTTVVFIIKYLKKLGYEVNNTLFKDKSVYFRNALVRSNYYNKELKIESTQEFLIKFFENLLLSKNNNLSSKDLIIDELIKKEN